MINKYIMKLVVGVTLYNSGNIVEKTLQTIKNQTFKKFVCYITDDLSTDNSVEVVENFIKGSRSLKFCVRLSSA